LNELVFEKELGLEARQLGITVSDQERADRIRQLIPTAFMGGSLSATTNMPRKCRSVWAWHS